MTQTNAQAALQAAALVYEGGRGHTDSASVTVLATKFKEWLDEHDAKEEPEPELSHHISCDSRRGAWACNCNPIPFHGDPPAPPYQMHDAVAKASQGGKVNTIFPLGKVEDKRSGPKHFVRHQTGAYSSKITCHCGWDPYLEVPLSDVLTVDRAKMLVQDHIAENK